jgi:hypothetical protein
MVLPRREFVKLLGMVLSDFYLNLGSFGCFSEVRAQAGPEFPLSLTYTKCFSGPICTTVRTNKNVMM